MDDIWQSISTATVIIPSVSMHKINVLECHSEYGLESLSVGAVEQAKDCFKTMEFTHCMELKHSWGQAPSLFSYFNESDDLTMFLSLN